MTWPTAEGWTAIAAFLSLALGIVAYAVKLILRRNTEIRELRKALYEMRIELAANDQGDANAPHRGRSDARI